MNVNLLFIIGDTIDFLKSKPSFLDLYYPRPPIQGLRANIISAYDKGRGSLRGS